MAKPSRTTAVVKSEVKKREIKKAKKAKEISVKVKKKDVKKAKTAKQVGVKVKKRDGKKAKKAKEVSVKVKKCNIKKAMKVGSGTARHCRKHGKKHHELVDKIRDNVNKFQKVRPEDKRSQLMFLRAMQKGAQEVVDMYRPLGHKAKAEFREMWLKPSL